MNPRVAKTRRALLLSAATLLLVAGGAALRQWRGRGAGGADGLPLSHRFLLAGVVPAEIKIYSPVEAPAALFRRCEAEVARCVAIFSPFDPASEISRLNARAGAQDVEVSEDMAAVLTAAATAWERTEGAFDVTVLPLVRAWKEAAGTGVAPDPARLEALLRSVGMGKVAFDPASRRIRFRGDGVQLDLGGLAEGYVVDRVVALLKAGGVRKGLVNLGGDLRVFGGTAGDPFEIGVQHPRRAGELLGRVRVEDGAVGTSGDYEQYVSVGGRRYSHILDPTTGRPVPWSPSVTVLAGDAITADALATGLSVLGAERGLAVARRLAGVECLFVRQDGEGRMTRVSSPGMAARFREAAGAGIPCVDASP